jgi:competence protein ComEA
MKNFLKDYFSFSKKEFNGILILLILIAGIFIFPFIYQLFQKPEVYEFKQFKNEMEQFQASAMIEKSYSYKNIKNEIEDKEPKATYFNFDPNGLPAHDWKKLGLSDRQIKIIKNYESKGGKFYSKEDVKKIYSITASQFTRLEPYITIKPSYPKEKEYKSYRDNKPENTSEKYSKKPIPAIVELNDADSVKMETIRGIGPAFASRIIKYRSRLGGFYSKQQLREVFGLDSAKYEQIKDLVSIDASSIRKINVNTATFDELRKHPYLSYKQMNAIIQYRKQHGEYKSVDDLKKVVLLNAEIIRKIEPYIIY